MIKRLTLILALVCLLMLVLPIPVYAATPSVTTSSVQSITDYSAEGYGTVTNTGGATITMRGVQWGYHTVATWHCFETGSFGTGAYSCTLDDLNPSTVYWYRAFAVNSYGVGYGDWEYFTTTTGVPTLTTDTATNVDGSSALLQGSLDNVGGLTITRRGFKYGLTQTDSWDTYEVGDFYPGDYSSSIGGLAPGTIYWFRAYAENSEGTGYGEWVYFTTIGGPEVTTLAATHIGGTTVRLHGYLVDDGGDECEYRFQHGYATGAYDFDTDWSGDVETDELFYETVTGLSSNTTYYYRVQVRNGAASDYGDELSFTTAWELLSPLQFTAQGISGTEISLWWIEGGSTDNTMIRMSPSAYPTSVADGTQAYFGPSSSYLVEDLLPGTTYYFRAWGESGGDYSSNYTQILTTTLAGSPSAGATPSDPSGWFIIPSTARITGLPFYEQINYAFESYGLPHETGWILGALFLVALAAVGVLLAFRPDPTGDRSKGIWASLIVMVFGIVIWNWMGVLSLWLILIPLIMGGTYAFIRSRT